jgi:hypothetical protein
MIKGRTLSVLALGFSILGSADAAAFDGKFKGVYVCAKLPTTRDILRAPIDMVIQNDTVLFARPLFNLDGSRVVGSEIASGTIGQDGTMHLTSTWSFLGNTARAEYAGTITASGGTLIGAQNWRSPNGTGIARPCSAALVPAPDFSREEPTETAPTRQNGSPEDQH